VRVHLGEAVAGVGGGLLVDPTEAVPGRLGEPGDELDRMGGAGPPQGVPQEQAVLETHGQPASHGRRGDGPGVPDGHQPGDERVLGVVQEPLAVREAGHDLDAVRDGPPVEPAVRAGEQAHGGGPGAFVPQRPPQLLVVAAADEAERIGAVVGRDAQETERSVLHHQGEPVRRHRAVGGPEVLAVVGEAAPAGTRRPDMARRCPVARRGVGTCARCSRPPDRPSTRPRRSPLR
jgi:hypothetical protein